MANEEHLNILKQGVEAWNKWREEHPDIRPDLPEADLREANLRGADLREADFGRADLLQANLSRANLSGALFHGTDLSEALLLQADPRGRRRRPGQTRSRLLAEQPPQPVLLGASAPEAVRPGHTLTARVVAYEKSRAKKVEKLLHQLSPSARHILGIKACRWQLGTHVTIRLSGQALTTPLREQTFTWEGDHTLIDFDVTVQPRTQAGLTTLTFDVAIEDVLVARLRVDVAIRAQLPTDSVTIVQTEAARTAFASYAKEDQQRVLDHAASVRISAGLDVFLDCLALHPGEEGKPRVEKEILPETRFSSSGPTMRRNPHGLPVNGKHTSKKEAPDHADSPPAIQHHTTPRPRTHSCQRLLYACPQNARNTVP